MQSPTSLRAAAALAACLAVSSPALADETQARDIFKAMSDFLVAQPAMSFDYDATLEVVTADLQKVGFASSGAVTVNRPDKIRMTRTGGFIDAEMVYDGKMLTVHGRGVNVFARHKIEGTLDELIDTLRHDFELEAPAADLLAANPYELMMSNATQVSDLGSGIIRGKECDHLAFRTADTDWQIWIAHGDRPLPCRFTITSKMMAMAPSYTIEFSGWKTGADVAADDFQLQPGDGATEVAIGSLRGFSEIPPDGEGDAQ